MKFLLDTNVCSAHMRRPAQLAHRFIQYFDQLALPTRGGPGCRFGLPGRRSRKRFLY